MMPNEPIRISPGEAGRLIVQLPYFSPDHVAKMKTPAGRRWHADGRYWTVPRIDDVISHLLTLVAGQPIEREPSLRSVMVHDHRKPPGPATRSKLLEEVRLAVRARRYRHRTEKTYGGWIRRFLLFHRHHDSSTISGEGIDHFLNSLASDNGVSASTQNQVLNTILFLFRDVLSKESGYINDVVRAKRPKRLPVALAGDPARLIREDGLIA